MGESGSGKTTLLNILAALDRPTAGECDTVRESTWPASGKRTWPPSAGTTWALCSRISTCWTPFPCRTTFSCPWYSRARRIQEMERRLAPLAETLGIAGLLDKYPYEVSGGQKQRVRRGPRPDHSARSSSWPTSPPARLDSRASRQPAGPVRDDQPGGTDHPHGHPLHQGRQPRRAGAVYPGRRGVPPALPGRGRRNEEMYQQISDTLTRLTARR